RTQRDSLWCFPGATSIPAPELRRVATLQRAWLSTFDGHGCHPDAQAEMPARYSMESRYDAGLWPKAVLLPPQSARATSQVDVPAWHALPSRGGMIPWLDPRRLTK